MFNLKFRIRQILRHTPCSISSRLRKQIETEKQQQQQQQQDNATFSSIFTQQSINTATSEPVSESFSSNQSNDLTIKQTKKSEHQQSVTVNLNHRIINLLTSLFSLMRNLPRQGEQRQQHHNGLIKISPKTEKIFTMESQPKTDKKEESLLSKFPFKINTNSEYYDYDDILTYFKAPTQPSSRSLDSQTNTKVNKLRLIENNPCNQSATPSPTDDKLGHVLYDIPEEECDDDSSGIGACTFKPEKYVFNLDEILKI